MSINKKQYAEALTTITLLAEKFPRAFFVREIKRRPLQIGIDVEVMARLNGALQPHELTNALRVYVSAGPYLAGLYVGATRIDLQGESAGTVNTEAARKAAGQLASKLLRADARRKARIAAAVVKEPEPAIEKGPKRLTLADLKTAYLARQAVATQ